MELKRRAVRSGAAVLATLAVLAVAGVLGAEARAAVAVVENAASVEVAERTATLAWSVRLAARAEGWQTLRLLPPGVALRSAELTGGQGHLERSTEGVVAHLRGPGEFKVDLSAVIEVVPRGVERSVRLPLLESVGARCRVSVPGADQSFEVLPDCPMEQSGSGGRSVATLYPAAGGWVTVRWLPRTEERARAPVFEARESSALRVGPGVVRRSTVLTVTVQRGEVGEVTVEAPGEVDVLGVATPQGAPALVEGWRLEGVAGARRVVVRLTRGVRDRAQVAIVSEQVFEGGAVAVRPFVVAGAARQTGRFAVAEEGPLKFIDSGSTGVAPAEAAGAARVFDFVKLPAELRLKSVAVPPRVTSFAATHARLHAGVVETATTFDLRIENNSVERLRIGLEEGMVVLEALGEGVERWSASEKVIDVRLARPVKGNYTLTVRCLQNLRRINGVLIPRLRCLEAERESGAVAVSAGPDVALQHYKSHKVAQVEPERLPDWLRRLKPKLAYLYDQPEGMLAVQTNLALPALRAEVFGVARVYDDLIREEHLFLCEVERRPVFSLALRLPEGLNVVSLAGDAVQDWEVTGNGQALTVALRRGVMGRTQMQLVAERRLGAERSELALGGVSLMGAERTSGWFGVVTDANVDLRAVATPGLTPADIRKAPQLLTAYRDLRLAFQWSAEGWGLRCAATPVRPRIEADVRSALLFSAGAVRVRSEVVWHIARARVSRLRLELPEEAVDVSVSGENVRAQEESGRSRLLVLDDPVKGEYAAVVTYILLADRAGAVAFRPPGVPEAERVRGAVGVYVRDSQIEVEAKELRNVSRAGAAPRLDSGALAPAGAFAYSEADARIEFRLKGYALADGVVIAADQCRLATVVKDAGQAVTYLTCQVRHAGAQYFTLLLPPKSQLWGAYVLGAPVRANRLADGRLQVPIQDVPRGAPFELGVIWAEPVAELGMGGSVRLASPRLGLPAQAVDWDVYLPAEYQLVSAGGNMKAGFRRAWHREGMPGLAAEYGQRAWPVVRGTLETVGWLLVLAGVCALVWALARVRMWWLKKHPKEEVRGTSWSKVVIETLAVLAIVVILAGMLLPALSSSREKSRRTACVNNLAQIAVALESFMGDHNGKMPDSLMQLYPKYVSDARVFRCPEGGIESGYEYSGPIPAKERIDTRPMVWDRPENHGDGGNVLYADHSTRWIGDPTRRAATALRSDGVSSISRAVYAYTQNTGDFFLAQSRPSSPSAAPAEIGQSNRELARPVDKAFRMATTEGEPEFLEVLAVGKKGDGKEQAVREKRLAQSHFSRGELDKAETYYKSILRKSPGSQEAQEGLDRIAGLKAKSTEHTNGAKVMYFNGAVKWQGANRISNDGEGYTWLGADTDAFLLDGTVVKTESHSAGALAAYAQQLKRGAAKGWEDEVAEPGLQRDIVALAAGEKSEVKLSGGGRVEFKAGDLSISGRDEQRRAVEAAASAVREKMLAKARELTAEEKKRGAEVDARRRAEMELRKKLSASAVAAKGKAGTLTGSRGAGAMPLEIRFPSFGTRAYPFHMEYAGASQARIEVACVRSGAALALQGLAGLAVFLMLGFLAWRRPRAGGAAVLAVGALCAVALTGDDALRPYLVMALAGACAAAVVAAARLWLFHRSHSCHSTGVSRS
jgi:hypothetical protein